MLKPMGIVHGSGVDRVRSVQFATVVASASGATAVVAAQPGRKIVVVNLNLTVNGAVNVKFQSAANDITGLHYANAAGWRQSLPTSSVGWFSTNAGEALNINLSAAVAVGGHIAYFVE
jgi:hypothetical protein